MTRTTSSSTKVNPAERFALDGEFIDRDDSEENCNNDASYEDAKHDDAGGFEHTQQPLHCQFELGVVDVRNLNQDVVQTPALFSHSNEMRRQGRDRTLRPQRRTKRLAFADPNAHRLYQSYNRAIGDDLAGQVEGQRERHTTAMQ